MAWLMAILACEIDESGLVVFRKRLASPSSYMHAIVSQINALN